MGDKDLDDNDDFWDDDDDFGNDNIDANNDETFGNAIEWNEDEHEDLIARDHEMKRRMQLEDLQRPFQIPICCVPQSVEFCVLAGPLMVVVVVVVVLLHIARPPRRLRPPRWASTLVSSVTDLGVV